MHLIWKLFSAVDEIDKRVTSEDDFIIKLKGYNVMAETTLDRYEFCEALLFKKKI